MEPRGRLNRSQSFSAPTPSPLADAPITPKTPSKKGSIISLFKQLTIAKEPVPKLDTKRSSLKSSLSQERSPRLTSDAQLLQQYLCTLFSNVHVISCDDTLRIIFTTESKNTTRTDVQCIPEKLRPLLDTHKVLLEISIEAFLCAKEWRYAQFLEEVSPSLVSLRCFPVSGKAVAFAEKWIFPKLERLDFSGCNVTKDDLQNLLCPALHKLILRKVRSLSFEELVGYPSSTPTLLDMDLGKGIAISREQINKAFDGCLHNLFFFLKSAKMFHHKDLEEVCTEKLKLMLGPSTRIAVFNGEIICTFKAIEMRIDSLKKVLHPKIGVTVKLIIEEKELQNSEVRACLEWLSVREVPIRYVLQLNQLSSVVQEMPVAAQELQLATKEVLTANHIKALSGNFANLDSLSLSGCQIEEKALIELRLPNLRFLSLANTPIGDSDLLALNLEANSLRHLVLDNTLVSSKGCKLFEQQGSLESLSLAGCHKITEEATALIANFCPRLRFLSFYGSKGASEKMLAMLLERCVELQGIDVRQCEKIPTILQAILLKQDPFQNHAVVDWNEKTSEQTEHLIARSVATSRKLLVKNCEKVTDEMVLALLSKFSQNPKKVPLASLAIHDFVIEDARLIEPIRLFLPTLRKLDLRGPLGFAGLIQLVQLKQLVSLSLSNNQKSLTANLGLAISDDGLKLLSEHLTELEQLKLERLSEVTEKGIGYLLANCKRLRSLRIKECPKISREALDKLLSEQKSALVDFEMSSSPYQIEVRPATEEDRKQREAFIDQQLDTFGTMIFESITSSPEALSHFRYMIGLSKRKIEALKENVQLQEMNIQEASKKLFNDTKVVEPLYVPFMCKDCLKSYTEAVEQLEASAKVVRSFSQLMVTIQKEIEERGLDLVEFEQQLDQGEQIVKALKSRIQMLVKEKIENESRAFVLSVTCNDYKSLKPIETKLTTAPNAQDQTLVSLREQIAVREGNTKKFSFILLFSPEEIDKFVQLGIVKDWSAK